MLKMEVFDPDLGFDQWIPNKVSCCEWRLVLFISVCLNSGKTGLELEADFAEKDCEWLLKTLETTSKWISLILQKIQVTLIWQELSFTERLWPEGIEPRCDCRAGRRSAAQEPRAAQAWSAGGDSQYLCWMETSWYVKTAKTSGGRTQFNTALIRF